MRLPESVSKHRRIEAIDAARGTAMVFVFFSHFVEVYFRRHDLPLTLAYLVTMIASPAFIIISGVMLGVLYHNRKDGFHATRSRSIRRGIFLLTLGRVAIFVAHVPIAGGWQEALRWGFVTDTIGVCIIVGPLLVESMSRAGRFLIGVILVLASWLVTLLWDAELGLMRAFRELLFGTYGPADRFFVDVFPVFPWMGVYISATAVGECFGELSAAGETRRLHRSVFFAGITGIAGGVGLGVLRFGLRRMGEDVLGSGIAALLSPFQKSSPSPAYLLFYGGCAFVVLFLLMRYQDIGIVRHYSRTAAILGRTSLFVFILQYFVFFVFLTHVDVGPTVLWPLYFTLLSISILGAAVFWDRGNMNRWLTIPEWGGRSAGGYVGARRDAARQR